MQKEVLKRTIDQAEELAQNILDHKKILPTILENPESKKNFLGGMKKLTDAFNPQVKLKFLENALAILVNPPTDIAVNNTFIYISRDMDLTNVDQKQLEHSYLETVEFVSKSLNKYSDPPEKIGPLLEIGRIIAPSIKNKKMTVDALNHLSESFTEKDRKKILNEIKEIERSIPIIIYTKASEHTELDVNEFDAKVAALEDENSNRAIAKKLQVPLEDVIRSIRRNEHKGKFRKTGRKRTEERKQIVEEVKTLINGGLKTSAIATKLKMQEKQITFIKYDLRNKEEIPRSSRGRKKKTQSI